MKFSFWIWLLGAAAAVAGGADWRMSRTLSREIVAAGHHVDALRRADAEAAAAASEQQLAERAAEEKWDVAAAEMAVEQRYGPPPAKVWRSRIRALQEAMSRSETGPVPELALLQLKDWIDAAVRADGASPEQLRKVFAAIRHTAQIRVAEKIQEALKGFLATSGGVLPTDLRQLMPFLPAAVAPAMLEPYRLTKTGPVENSDEAVIEGKFGVVALSISPNGWSSNAKSGTEAMAEGQVVLSALGRSDQREEFVAWQAQMVAALEHVGPLMEQMVPESEMKTIGEQAKTAIREYMASHDGRPPRSVADLESTLPAAKRLAEAFRPIIANLDYAFEHEGQAPTAPGQLKRYSEALDDTQLLQRMRLTLKDGDHFDLDFDLHYCRAAGRTPSLSRA
jgi:hypothetical protein